MNIPGPRVTGVLSSRRNRGRVRRRKTRCLGTGQTIQEDLAHFEGTEDVAVYLSAHLPLRFRVSRRGIFFATRVHEMSRGTGLPVSPAFPLTNWRYRYSCVAPYAVEPARLVAEQLEEYGCVVLLIKRTLR